MPPSGFNQKAIKGLLAFLEGCYEDLLKAVGYSSDPKRVIQKELNDIERFLKDFTID